MNKLHIITPVKDAIDIAFQTIEAILNSEISIDYKYTVYNDFSTAENTEKLQSLSNEKGFELVNLPELTSHPSPNYLLILQLAQKKALQEKAHLIIVESDVIVEKNTIQNL
ncbi:MAG TPA: glycosyltransferase family 2 protein, partial [Paludibacteraceae bacterium]|nr:glycosyltransferase family 2 protein [Paludibacteraceae bacterium]